MILFTLFLIFFLLSTPASNAISISTGDPAPSFNLKAIDGKTISLNKYKGQVVVVIYWRTGQERSILALKDAYDVLKKYEKKDVQVISVIADNDNQEEAKKIFIDKEIDYSIFVDTDRQLFSDYGIKVYPTTLIIDKEGSFAYGIPSHPLTYKHNLEGYIKKMLGEIDETELEEVLSPHKEEKDKSTLEALRFYNLAFKFTQLQMLDIAIDTAIKSVEAKPEMVKSHILLGFLYLEINEVNKAFETFNKALELDPHSHDAKTGLGGALILQGDIDKAIDILNDAAIANPYPQMTYYELGRAYELKGEKDQSIEMYKKAIEKIIKKQVLPSFISRCE